MSKVYISGPITGVKDYDLVFMKAHEKLKLMGKDVLDLVDMTKYLTAQLEYETYMKLAFALIDDADEIYMIEGWERSAGANRELGYAIGKGKKVIYQKG